jgi:aspartate oxidase
MMPSRGSDPRAIVSDGALVDADVVVVGAGVAGLVLALDLAAARPGTRIVVLDKARDGAGGSTALAQGGMAAAFGPGDSPRLHAQDTIRAGDGLCDPAAVAVLAGEAPDRVRDLLRWGVRFDRRDGALHLAREGAQTVPRCVHAADATGAQMSRGLRDAVMRAAPPPLTRLIGTAVAVATTPASGVPARACGVWAVLEEMDASPVGPAQAGGLVAMRAAAVVLASGGCGGLYAATTNRDSATGDGLALAYEAGAALVDCEFVQFHPTGLRSDGVEGEPRLLLTEALRGAGAVLVDAHGRRFMSDYHEDAELAPRHVVTRAILDQPHGAWLDATALGAARLAAQFPTVLAGARSHGFDFATEPVPVAPTQHYLVGGVATDLDGATTLPGLYAVGETACTGVHGANRMAGNSLSEACVFAHRAARLLAARLDGADAHLHEPEPPPFGAAPAGDLTGVRNELRAAMTAGAGPVRSAASLDRADKGLAAAQALLGEHPALDPEAIELAHACRAARLVVRSARLRTESRGVHQREDAPQREPRWDGVHLRAARIADA